MQKFTSFPNPYNISLSTIKSVFSSFSSTPKSQNPDSVFLNYLIESFNFPQSRALSLSNQYSYVKSLEKPQNVCQFFRNIGFSDAQIQCTVRVSPQVLLCDVDKTLKPKIELFQNLGLVGSDLGKLLSKNSWLLTASLEKKLIPRIEILKQVLVNDKNNENLIRTLGRSNGLLITVPESRLSNNIEFLKSCGIVGSQLSFLLKNRARLFVMSEAKVKEFASQVSDMGFSVNSRMFVHGLSTLYCLSEETFERKLELFRIFGFSRDEFIEMFRRVPGLPTVSEKKLKSGLEFFLKKVGLEKAALYNVPLSLMFSMENRVIPRYRVFKILISRRLLKKECTFPQILGLSEKRFLQKFVLSFGDVAEELFLAYKGHSLGASSSSSSSCEEES